MSSANDQEKGKVHVIQQCQICFDQVTDPVNILGCMHVFCQQCLEAYVESMILDQNRFDDLKCPNVECNVRLKDEQIEQLTTPEVFKKFHKFRDNQRVAQDRDSLMFCIKPGCDCVIDLRYGKSSDKPKLVECPDCFQQICRDCRMSYHGENACEIRKTGLFDPQAKFNVGEMTLTYCPKCYIPIEKEAGCLQMRCYVCKYQYCWTCGYPGNNLFHRLQLFGEGTGGLCQLFNLIQTYFKNNEDKRGFKPIAYFFIGIFLIIWPPMAVAFYWMLAPFSYFIIPTWMFDREKIKPPECLKRLNLNKLFNKLIMGFLLFCSFPMFMIVSAIGSVLFILVWYPMVMILVPRQCILKRKRQRIDLHYMIQRMEEQQSKRAQRYAMSDKKYLQNKNISVESSVEQRLQAESFDYNSKAQLNAGGNQSKGLHIPQNFETIDMDRMQPLDHSKLEVQNTERENPASLVTGEDKV